VPGVRRQVSGVRRQVSGVRRQASGVRRQEPVRSRSDAAGPEQNLPPPLRGRVGEGGSRRQKFRNQQSAEVTSMTSIQPITPSLALPPQGGGEFFSALAQRRVRLSTISHPQRTSSPSRLALMSKPASILRGSLRSHLRMRRKAVEGRGHLSMRTLWKRPHPEVQGDSRASKGKVALLQTPSPGGGESFLTSDFCLLTSGF
jgi:hypothetical protein